MKKMVTFLALLLSVLLLFCLSSVEACTNTSLRLVGGTYSYEGRLEICINNVWGTVCDDEWTYNNNAQVACRQLGYSTVGATYHSDAYYGEGYGSILLDNVQCSGYESTLLECTHNPIGTNNCGHFDDVGVSCPGGTGPTPVCTYGELRLVTSGGYTSHYGRLEICLNGAWGTVCDDYFTDTNSRVVCRQLGYSTTGATYHSYAYYGRGTGSIYLDYVRCTGTESTLLQCPRNSNIVSRNCLTHSEDVSVVCSSTRASTCTYGSLRLVGGSNSHEGRVEICINNDWGTVCDDYWTDTNAQVACRQLGYSTIGAIYHSNAYYGEGSGSIQLDNVQCSGYESSLLDCTHNPIGTNDCSHSEDVGVSCSSSSLNTSCTYGSLRLVGGIHSHEGRVEICINGVWGTVCDDFFGNRDAKVVCRQLGYPDSGAVAHGNAYYGSGSGRILLDNVMCSGTESRLLDCVHNSIGSNDCSHSEDVGVACLALHPGIIAAIVICTFFMFLAFITIAIVVLVVVCYRRRKRAHLYSVLRSPSVTVACPPPNEKNPPSVRYPPPPPSYSEAVGSNFEQFQTAPVA